MGSRLVNNLASGDLASVEALAVVGQRSNRSVALQGLYIIDRFEYSLSVSDVVENIYQDYEIRILQDSFAVQIMSGVLEHKEELDTLIDASLKNWEAPRVACLVRLILRMGLWELLKNKQATKGIVVNEYIELAKAYVCDDSYKFINGILDSLAK